MLWPLPDALQSARGLRQHDFFPTEPRDQRNEQADWVNNKRPYSHNLCLNYQLYIIRKPIVWHIKQVRQCLELGHLSITAKSEFQNQWQAIVQPYGSIIIRMYMN